MHVASRWMPEPFVVNVADASAYGHPAAGSTVPFEDPQQPFPEIGINLRILEPGQSNARYHRENAQEDFLVLGGKCTLILNGEEHTLRAWDFVHCPAGTDHVFVGAGDGPCWILMVGARRADEAIHYPTNPTAARHRASAPEPTDDPTVAYADREGSWEPTRPPWPPT
jgi:uncharacterized cupin superfamily protein